MRRILSAVLFLLVPAMAVAQVERITAEVVAGHVFTLAHDSMRGRATPSRGLELAASYVESVYRRAGLMPAGENGRYQQRFPVAGEPTKGTAPNVVAVLRGRDLALAGQYVAVVAHMDHVGVRPRPGVSDSIFNGADDNASGTAGLLAIAEAFAGQAPRPRRSVLFLAVSGEERGLLGSSYFVQWPTVPLDSIVALVNLDMIGRNRPDSVYLNGWGKSAVAELVRQIAASTPGLGLAVGPDPEDRPITPADSDHYPFQRRGIPYAFFYTGAHPDYHRAGDEPERVDADKAARVARLAYLTLQSLADSPGRPAWDTDARRLNVGAGR
jgi:hypothetical protein